MASPGLAFALVLNGLVLATVALLSLRNRDTIQRIVASGSRQDVDDWYAETVRLVQEVNTAADTDNDALDPEEIRRTLVPLVSRLEGHVRRAPNEADHEVVQRLYDLSVDCRAVGFERPEYDAVRRGDFIEPELDRLAEAARTLERDLSERS